VSLEVAGPTADILVFLADVRDRFGGVTTPQGYAEVSLRQRPHEVLADLDAVAATAVEPKPRVKFRTGGTTAEAFPSDAEFALGIVGATRRGLPFKLTAGLHDPARHRDPVTGFEHHGLLNVLLAADAALRGAEVEEVRAVLANRDEAGLAAAVRDLPEDRAREVRRQVLSVGTCSIDECVDGLTRVGVLDLPVGAAP